MQGFGPFFFCFSNMKNWISLAFFDWLLFKPWSLRLNKFDVIVIFISSAYQSLYNVDYKTHVYKSLHFVKKKKTTKHWYLFLRLLWSSGCTFRRKSLRPRKILVRSSTVFRQIFLISFHTSAISGSPFA